MKYFRVYAGYAKSRPPSKYDYKVDDDIKIKEIKKWFESTYSWLDVYKVEEISEDEASKWALRIGRKGDVNEMDKT